MRTLSFLLGFTLFLAPALAAQRLSGEGTCAKPEVSQVPVGDRPDHTFSISKNSCSWTKPFEIAGARGQGGPAVQFDERDGSTSRFHGYFLDRMSTGDTVHYRYKGTAVYSGEAPRDIAWNWAIAGGTGRFRGLTGKGTCKGSPGGRWACSGTYRLKE